jgi:dTDP-4-dehydrorhamnose reductase
MRVLVLGASGQLGSEFFRQPSAEIAGIELVPIGRRELDVSNLESIEPFLAGFRFDVLINCTCYNRVDDSESRATEAIVLNAQAPRRMASACRKQAARLVHVSTDYVFDGRQSRPYVETDPASPLNVYGASKLLGENFVRHEYPEGSMILRLASLFGIAGASGKGGNFIEAILRTAREKGEVRVVQDIKMSPTGAADASRVILALVRAGATPGVYHVVNSGEATWFQFAREIVRQAGLNTSVVPIRAADFPTAAIRPRYSVLNHQKVRELVGPVPAWENALKRYLRDKGYIC